MRAEYILLGYEESAVRLQKEWNHPDPQQLSCAPHVPNHALVVLLNRGLMYNVNERENLQVSNRSTYYG